MSLAFASANHTVYNENNLSKKNNCIDTLIFSYPDLLSWLLFHEQAIPPPIPAEENKSRMMRWIVQSACKVECDTLVYQSNKNYNQLTVINLKKDPIQWVSPCVLCLITSPPKKWETGRRKVQYIGMYTNPIWQYVAFSDCIWIAILIQVFTLFTVSLCFECALLIDVCTYI